MDLGVWSYLSIGWLLAAAAPILGTHALGVQEGRTARSAIARSFATGSMRGAPAP